MVVARDGATLLRAAWAPYDHRRAALVYSVSKSVTALAVGLLADEGRLALDDPVDRHLDLPNPHGLTLRHLLTMSTGHSRAQTLAMPPSARVLLATAPAHPVGSRFAYSSPATATLGRVVAAVAGEQPTAYLRPRLLEPLGIGDRWWRHLDGVEEGFSGLHLTVDDQARIGGALAGGRWGSVLPGGLVAQVAGLRVPTGGGGGGGGGGGDRPGDEPDPAAPDWSRGYGYGVWHGRHGIRMDGAYGQLTLVVPETGVVVAYQGATTDTQRLLDVLWLLVESFRDGPLPPADPATTARLADRVAALDSWPAALTPHPDPGPDATGWTLADAGPASWRLTVPPTTRRPGGSLDLTPDRWTPGTLAPTRGARLLPVAARAERRPDGSVRAQLVVTSSPHRVLLTRSPDAADAALGARWHTAPLWRPDLATLLVPPLVAGTAPGPT
nr:serine hydrolase domain-containing protein [Cellulomonas hominis]